MNKIELVNPIKALEKDYRKVIIKAIDLNLITLDEWNTRFKNYRDDCGYSFIHYLECVFHGEIEFFLTINPIMLKNRKELIKRFEVEIKSLKEL